MRKKQWVAALLGLAIALPTTVFADIPSYLDEQEYTNILTDNFYEERGIVLENDPYLGILTIKNGEGKSIKLNYYREEVVVEKDPYYESEDRIGYLDELFPHFSFDPRDTTVDKIKPGDGIYVRYNKDHAITYISAYNDYIMRYAKVQSFNYNTGTTPTLTLEDEKGNIYTYEIGLDTPVTRGGTAFTISEIKLGDWAKVLVSQHILGEGMLLEEVKEVVLDADARYISNVYRGQVAGVDTYKNMLNVKNAQSLIKTGWSYPINVLALKMNPREIESYLIGQPVSLDYIARSLRNGSGYVYVAAEQHMGKENAIKLNFQSKMQTTLPFTTVTYASPGVIKLLTGETLYLAKDAIVVRDKRLVEPYNIMVGDRVQTVITGEHKVAVANIVPDVVQGALQIYRGRVKKISDNDTFEVETFSMLEGNKWYYHPTPRTFTIDTSTKFYADDGIVEGGIKQFLGYGEDSKIGDVYTIVSIGDRAYSIVDMPYTKESVKGEVYAVGADGIQIKDVYYYHRGQKKWLEYSKKNTGATINLSPNTIIVREGKVVPPSKLQKGDKIKIMLEESIKDTSGKTTGYVIIVEG